MTVSPLDDGDVDRPASRAVALDDEHGPPRPEFRVAVVDRRGHVTADQRRAEVRVGVVVYLVVSPAVVRNHVGEERRDVLAQAGFGLLDDHARRRVADRDRTEAGRVVGNRRPDAVGHVDGGQSCVRLDGEVFPVHGRRFGGRQREPS